MQCSKSSRNSYACSGCLSDLLCQKPGQNGQGARTDERINFGILRQREQKDVFKLDEVRALLFPVSHACRRRISSRSKPLSCSFVASLTNHRGMLSLICCMSHPVIAYRYLACPTQSCQNKKVPTPEQGVNTVMCERCNRSVTPEPRYAWLAVFFFF